MHRPCELNQPVWAKTASMATWSSSAVLPPRGRGIPVVPPLLDAGWTSLSTSLSAGFTVVRLPLPAFAWVVAPTNS